MVNPVIAPAPLKVMLLIAAPTRGATPNPPVDPSDTIRPPLGS